MTKYEAKKVLSQITEDPQNVFVAITPGGIEDQEARGQAELIASDTLPKECRPDRARFEALGVLFGAEVDDLFVKVRLPPGWKKIPTHRVYWTDLVDEEGRVRAHIFYKAAFYDRRADMCLAEE